MLLNRVSFIFKRSIHAINSELSTSHHAEHSRILYCISMHHSMCRCTAYGARCTQEAYESLKTTYHPTYRTLWSRHTHILYILCVPCILWFYGALVAWLLNRYRMVGGCQQHDLCHWCGGRWDAVIADYRGGNLALIQPSHEHEYALWRCYQCRHRLIHCSHRKTRRRTVVVSMLLALQDRMIAIIAISYCHVMR